MPTFPVVDGRQWKAQVPYLARHFRVVTIDPRGNGRSDRPQDPAAYGDDAYVGDVIAVMDDLGTRRGVPGLVVSAGPLGGEWSRGRARPGAGTGPLGTGLRALAPEHVDVEQIDDPRWVADYAGGWSTTASTWSRSAHSTKVYEDLVELGARHRRGDARREVRRRPKRLDRGVGGGPGRCRTSLPGPGHARHRGRLPDPERGTRFAGVAGGRLVVIEGAGHVRGASPRARQHADQGVRRHAHLDLTAP